jgi:DNA-binding MarR family transcriptional regulator
MRVLFALRRGGRPYSKRPTDLFKSLLVTSGAITKQVDRLARIDLVERLPDPEHRGGYLIHLTRQGKRVADAAMEMFSRKWSIHTAFAGLNQTELNAGIRLFDRLLTEVETAIGSAKRNTA